MTLTLPDEAAYRTHFYANFPARPLTLHTAGGGARVYFKHSDFDHAFFESPQRDKSKSEFSLVRAERMDDIAPTLADASADRFAGWDGSRKQYDHTRTVCVASGDFVIVVRLRLSTLGELRGNFVTCYVADNSIGKIRQSPVWNEGQCIASLTKRSGR